MAGTATNATLDELRLRLGKVLRSIDEVFAQMQHNDRSEEHPLLTSIIRGARIRVEWEQEGSWQRSRHGAALLIATRGGLIVRMPRHSLAWNRFVLAHEVGHSLFYDTSEILPQHATATALRERTVPLRRDIWVSAEIEEQLCDEIADEILMPDRIVRTLVNGSGTRLAQVRQIAELCHVPIDRALRRWIASANPKEGYGHQCVQIVVWKIAEESAKSLRFGDQVTPLYSEGVARLRREKYSASQAGLDSLTQAPQCKPTKPARGRRVRLPELYGYFDIEALPLNTERTRWVAAYDRRDRKPGPFSSPRLLARRNVG